MESQNCMTKFHFHAEKKNHNFRNKINDNFTVIVKISLKSQNFGIETLNSQIKAEILRCYIKVMRKRFKCGVQKSISSY